VWFSKELNYPQNNPQYGDESLEELGAATINLLDAILEDFIVLENIESAIDHNVIRMIVGSIVAAAALNNAYSNWFS